MRILDRRPSLRWIAPVAALAVVGGGALVANTASADPTLPRLSAEQLIAKVAQAEQPDLSGTVTETADLGLPALPISNGEGNLGFTNLLSGTNTLHVYSAGDDKSRVMLSGSFGEADLVRNGTDVWAWNSKDKTATHTTLPSGSTRTPKQPTDLPKTPQEAAKTALDAVDSSTTVSLARNQTVAGRSAYELVLTPKSSSTLVGSVRIAVDATTYLPLRVDAFAKADPNTPAFELAYTDISYATPADSVFAFSPPAGTKVTEKSVPKSGTPGSLHGSKGTPTKAQREAARQQAEKARSALADDVKTYGDGWSSVVVATIPTDALSGGSTGTSNETKSGHHRDQAGSGQQAEQWQQTLNALPAVSGQGWTGHALKGTLFSLVVTDDNRVAVGAVSVDQLVKDLG